MIDYEAKWRDSLCPFFKPVNAIHLILMIVRFANDGQKLTHWYLLYGSTTLSLLLITIAIEFKRAIIDYVHIWIIFVRILVTFTLMYLVTTGTEGFEHIDLKELCQAIDFIAMSYLVLTFVNWKFNLIVTAPITMISCYIATKMSLTPIDDNMACFKEHETFSDGLAANWLMNQVYLFGIAYYARLVTLERFIDLRNSEKQQDQLQNLFDN